MEQEVKNMLGKKSIIELSPIIIKKKEKSDKICYFFDTDDYCSPFDTNMGYDAGFDVVIPYCKIRADQVVKLVQDAMFSRKVGAPTVFFIGGSDVEECDRVAEQVLNALVPPFEVPVIIDPRGAHTTASAIVAKTIKCIKKHGWYDLKGKRIAIIGGTGPVGQIAALIASKHNADVIITSRRENIVKDLAKVLTNKAGERANEISGATANSEDDYYEIIKHADIIWSVGKAGIQMISKITMEKLAPNKIIVDINLVPPYGIEGMDPSMNDTEFYPGIYGIGALDIGKLKYNVEKEIFKEAAASRGKIIFDYNIAFDIAIKLMSK
jgi:methylene-tetrahydromethanopterin dehydrogenase